MYVLYWSCYVITYSWCIVYVSVPGYDNGTAGYTDCKLYLDSDWLFYWSWTLFTIREDCEWTFQRFTRKTWNVSNLHQVTENRNLLHGMCWSSSLVASWTIYKVIKECFYKLGAECTPDLVRARQVVGVQYPTWLSAKLLQTVYTIFTVLFSAWAHSQNCCMINFLALENGKNIAIPHRANLLAAIKASLPNTQPRLSVFVPPLLQTSEVIWVNWGQDIHDTSDTVWEL